MSRTDARPACTVAVSPALTPQTGVRAGAGWRYRALTEPGILPMPIVEFRSFLTGI
jgi:hypothetical protein